MTDRHERYVSPEGNTVDCIAVTLGPKESLACVTVQMDAARESFKSQIWFAEDFSSEELSEAWDKPGWIISMWMAPSNRIWCITSRNHLISGPPDDFVEAPFSEVELNRIRGFAENEIYILGRGGLVLRSNAEAWEPIPIEGADRLYDITKTASGELFVCAESGGFFHRASDSDGWEPLDTGTNVELYAVLAAPDGYVYLAGEAGFCARYRDGELEMIEADPERNYRALAAWQGNIYFGSGGKGIEMLEGTGLVSFEKEIFAYSMSANADYLGSAGLTEVARWDGEDWDYEEFE